MNEDAFASNLKKMVGQAEDTIAKLRAEQAWCETCLRNLLPILRRGDSAEATRVVEEALRVLETGLRVG
jgi:hypothetical protein